MISLLEASAAATVRRSVPANPRLNTATLRVLFAQRDVIGKIGGGEAAGARLLGQPIDVFVTWPVSQPPRTELASNFELVRLDEPFRAALRQQLRSLPRDLRTKDCEDFQEAVCLAHAVRGREFDVVECPDYVTYGRFLPFALAEYGVKYKRLVCSLHGLLSRTFEIENEFHEVISPDKLQRIRQAEREFIFGAADVRYGLSERYVLQVRSREPLPVALVDPLCALPKRSAATQTPSQDRVWFVARQDRFKGADLFLAAIFRAGPELWDHYSMCGPSVRLANRPSVFEGMSYCRHRGMPFRYGGPLPYDRVVRNIYQTGGLVVVPSREETFNLVSVEALLNGAPVLISKYAGAADFIRNRFGKDFAGAIEFDPFDDSKAAGTIRDMWRNLEEHRRALKRALDEVDLTPQPHLLTDAYSSEARYSSELRNDAFRAWDRIIRNLFVRRPADVESDTPPGSDAWQFLDLQTPARNAIRTTRVEGSALFKLADAVLEQSPRDNLLVSLHQSRRLAALSPYINRARIYRHLADCEQTARPAVAAAYRLRAFRMGRLPATHILPLRELLHKQGFVQEEACFTLWTDPGKPGKLIADYLEQRRQQLLHVRVDHPEYVLDRRTEVGPRVSIIVSIYNAPKPVLDHFMKRLTEVAMVKDHRAEVVFIDSGSPQEQRSLLEANPALSGTSYVLIRSHQRETIQAAWNRGLHASRGGYITCLGVDEGVTEYALDDLTEFLDRHPETDWVTANTVVTQVDGRGNWKRDVMGYARPTYSRFNYFNDCTYINYVGGLYRRSIHDRFGWYDGSFKGAGDTEFKCRVFSSIRTAALPKTLGFYFDFPAERVTNSANAEVEDLRAWYVFRTPGGLEYLMGKESVAAWEELFWTAISGKRCWSKTPADCDLTFAENILTGLLELEPSHRLGTLARGLRAINREMRLLQDWHERPAWLGAIAKCDLIERSAAFFRKCARLRPDLAFPPDFRSDAFFFAHSWTW